MTSGEGDVSSVVTTLSANNWVSAASAWDWSAAADLGFVIAQYPAVVSHLEGVSLRVRNDDFGQCVVVFVY